MQRKQLDSESVKSNKSAKVEGLLDTIEGQVLSADPKALDPTPSLNPSVPQDVWQSYLSDVANYPLIPWKDQLEMFRRYHDSKDQDLRDSLTTANLKLVIAWARKFKEIYPRASMMDLIQEGNLGLMKAVDRFDPGVGTRFSTYAIPWIKAYMRRYLIGENPYPERTVQGMGRARRAEAELTQKLGRRPTDSELAEFMDEDVDPDQVSFLRGPYVREVSLDAPTDASDGSQTTVGDLLPDKTQDTAREAGADVDAQRVRQLLNELPLRERTMLMMRLGMNEDSREYSLAEIGKMYGVSKQRAKQICDAALAKLKRALADGGKESD